ncbi:metallophosphoesterase [Myxococcota bacterium]|nr:metallophosphoesterase [Myxococcota bacterium]
MQPRRLLITSDMHLGRDCKEITGFRRTRPDPAFDQALIDMLDFYTSAREQEWKYVIAGDFIDFIEVVVVPEEKGPLAPMKLTFELTDEEREFGLGSEAERAIVKLEKTFEYHQAFFRRLAHFVKEGGELVLVSGNHDIELYWGKVQRVFRRMLSNLAFAGEHLDVDDAIERRNAFQARISFSQWVYTEPGRVWVEHGHQYDVYCSFDHQLYPVSPMNPRRIDTPLFSFAMRYFVNMLTDFTAHDADIWTWRDYAAWLRKKGVAGTVWTAKMGFRTLFRILYYTGQFAFGSVRRYTKEHNKNLAEEAKRFGVSSDKLAAIDGLRHTPVNRNLSEVMRLMFLDRILLGAGTLSLMMFVLLVVHDWWFELAGIAVLLLAANAINRRMAPRRFLLPGPKQAQAAQKIAELMEVPLVVMGHSHARRMYDLGSGRRYINTGCWLPPLKGEDHTDPQKPCSCKLSHVVVEDDGAAALRVFCKAAHTVRLTDMEEHPAPKSSETLDLLGTSAKRLTGN